MINPNKSYPGRSLAVVVKVDEPTDYIPYITIKTKDGRILRGSAARVHSQWKRIKVGDTVGYSMAHLLH